MNEIPLLKFLTQKEEYYHKWAENYYEKIIDLDIIKKIFSFSKLNNELIGKLNNNVTLKDLKEDIEEIGYPST